MPNFILAGDMWHHICFKMQNMMLNVLLLSCVSISFYSLYDIAYECLRQ